MNPLSAESSSWVKPSRSFRYIQLRTASYSSSVIFRFIGAGSPPIGVKVIDLRAVTLPYEFEISTAHGRNLVRVEHGRIAVIESDCPEQICVRQGYVQESGVPIVCLPHRLVIELEGDE